MRNFEKEIKELSVLIEQVEFIFKFINSDVITYLNKLRNKQERLKEERILDARFDDSKI